MQRSRGLLVIVTGPSAVGKGAICRALLERTPGVRFSVSMTTRPPRPGERHGVEYYFVTREEFEREIQRGGLLEWAEVYGNYYGTPRRPVEEALERGEDIILDIDLVGANTVKAKYPDAVSVFVIPPSMAELHARIRKRGSESEEAVQRRLQEAPRWVEQGLTYQYVVVNDDLDKAVAQLQAILIAEKCRTSRQGGQLIRRLLERGSIEDDEPSDHR
ncbi:MAG: guanylate kinase [Bacillota bacterium]|nr:MAG: guanylate kinase [Bacillota bacterium]